MIVKNKPRIKSCDNPGRNVIVKNKPRIKSSNNSGRKRDSEEPTKS